MPAMRAEIIQHFVLLIYAKARGDVQNIADEAKVRLFHAFNCHDPIGVHVFPSSLVNP
jgi:hypothetical protein